LDIIGRGEAFSEHRFQVLGVRFQAGSRVFTTDTLYETPWIDVSIWIQSTVSIAGFGLNSEPQNIEYRTAEFRSMVSLRSVFFIIGGGWGRTTVNA